MKRISSSNVEEVLGRQRPWLQAGQLRGQERHFAVCPYCKTPIQLKVLYRCGTDSPQPYGSHTGTHIEGFRFDPEDLDFCPFRHRRGRPDRSARRKMGSVARQLIETVVAEFDRMGLLLREDFGFPFSNLFAE